VNDFEPQYQRQLPNCGAVDAAGGCLAVDAACEPVAIAHREIRNNAAINDRFIGYLRR
jgi:hypothetical protein